MVFVFSFMMSLMSWFLSCVSGHVSTLVPGVALASVMVSSVDSIRCWIDTQGIPVAEQDQIIAEFKVGKSYNSIQYSVNDWLMTNIRTLKAMSIVQDFTHCPLKWTFNFFKCCHIPLKSREKLKVMFCTK